MTRDTASQLDLLSSRDIDARTDDVVSMVPANLGIVLDARDWLRFLVDEWWPAEIGTDGLLLGVEGIAKRVQNASYEVVAWIDGARLPLFPLAIYGEGRWRDGNIGDVRRGDAAVVWPAPIPLSAVTTFSVSTDKDKVRLSAMSKGFSNVGASPRPIEVKTAALRDFAGAPPAVRFLYAPPVRWNAFRGAVAMALWAVPNIDPWLDVFCESISVGARQETTATALRAPWLASPPWLTPSRSGPASPLWAASCDVLSVVDYRSGWRPIELLETILSRAVAFGAVDSSLIEFRNSTFRLLADSTTVDFSLGEFDPLGLAIQLVLLRPTADHYVTWREDSTSMPPGVWWTGAILSGLITGLRDLDTQYRGSAESREFLAVRTWNLLVGGESAWPDTYAENPSYLVSGDRVQFLDKGRLWSDRKLSQRGEWFRADFTNRETYAIAFKVANTLNPSIVRKNLRISDTELIVSGAGQVSVDKASRRIKVKGEIFIDIDSITFGEELDIDQFRDWIAVGLVSQRLPPVPKLAMSQVVSGEQKTSAVPDAGDRSVQLFVGLPGLSSISDFISIEEEQSLLRIVDDRPWLSELKRRVQHYGWKYDYRARSIDRSAYIGPLPDWANNLAMRLASMGLVTEMPDQVIVNEYIENQGISRHIDCLECFKGPVVTLSLGESWAMQFRHSTGTGKFETVLERRSAVILDGEARDKWTHEIPKRKKEGVHVRGRRVSITFRKVIVKDGRPRKTVRLKPS